MNTIDSCAAGIEFQNIPFFVRVIHPQYIDKPIRSIGLQRIVDIFLSQTRHTVFADQFRLRLTHIKKLNPIKIGKISDTQHFFFFQISHRRLSAGITICRRGDFSNFFRKGIEPPHKLARRIAYSCRSDSVRKIKGRKVTIAAYFHTMIPPLSKMERAYRIQ